MLVPLKNILFTNLYNSPSLNSAEELASAWADLNRPDTEPTSILGN